jgi:hypothetical protein
LECIICRKGIKDRFYLCPECTEEYGRDRKLWPGWLKFLVKDEKRLMREKTRLKQYETNFSTLDRTLFYAIDAKLYGS